MGLDMWLYKVTKINDAEVKRIKRMPIIERTKYCNDNYRVVIKEDIGKDSNRYDDMIPYMTKVRLNVDKFDYAKCLSDHGIEPNTRYIGASYGPTGAHYSFSDNREINLTRSEYDSYIYQEAKDAYIYICDEVLYWRKEHDLAEYISETIYTTKVSKLRETLDDPSRPMTQAEIAKCVVENCGYYKINKEDGQNILKYIKKHKDIYTQSTFGGASTFDLSVFLDDDIFYHEWY